MTEKNDYQRLASQFVDLWQKNMAATMNDSEFIRAFLQMMQASSFTTRENSPYANRTHSSHPAGASAAPDSRDHAIAGIQNSLASIEARLSTLERTLAALLSAGTKKPAKRVARTAKRPGTRKSSRKGSGKKNR